MSGPGWSRRALLTRLGAAGIVAGASLWAPRSAHAGPTTGKLLRTEDSRHGTTLWLELNAGPFPFRGKPYTDATTAVFVPAHYRVQRGRVDTVLHFHGHEATVPRVLSGFALREQLFDSKQNAILVVPQGPVNARDSSGGKLDRRGGLRRYLTELRRTLQTPAVREALGPAALPSRARIGTLVVSAHSGGYRVVSRCLRHGGYDVSEVYLFDALFGQLRYFLDWIVATKDEASWRRRHKLVSYYARKEVTARSLELMEQLRAAGISFLHEHREGRLSRRQLTKGRAIFIRSRQGHSGAAFKTNALRDCLFASRLQRLVPTDWFDQKRGPRPIDRRGG